MIDLVGPIICFLVGTFAIVLPKIIRKDETTSNARAARWCSNGLGIFCVAVAVAGFPGMPEKVVGAAGIVAAVFFWFFLGALLFLTFLAVLAFMAVLGEFVVTRTQRHHPAHAARAIWEKSKRKPKEKRKNEWHEAG